MRRTFLRNERLTLVPKPTNCNSSTTTSFCLHTDKKLPIDKYRPISIECETNFRTLYMRVWRCSCARARTTCHHNYAPELSNADSPEVKKECWLCYLFVFRRISFSFLVLFAAHCSFRLFASLGKPQPRVANQNGYCRLGPLGQKVKLR